MRFYKVITQDESAAAGYRNEWFTSRKKATKAAAAERRRWEKGWQRDTCVDVYLINIELSKKGLLRFLNIYCSE